MEDQQDERPDEIYRTNLQRNKKEKAVELRKLDEILTSEDVRRQDVDLVSKNKCSDKILCKQENKDQVNNFIEDKELRATFETKIPGSWRPNHEGKSLSQFLSEDIQNTGQIRNIMQLMRR